jgi:protein O-GlcNAc transferase
VRAPDAAINHFSLAENELNLHRLDRAEAGFRKAMTLTPGHPDARWKLAVTLGQLDRAAEAEALFRQAVAAGAPKSRDRAAFHYGIFLFERGRHAEALPQLEAATRAKPDDRMAWSWLARAQKALGKKEEAAASIARYRELQARADREETDFLLGLIRDKLEGGDGKTVPDRK